MAKMMNDNPRPVLQFDHQQPDDISALSDAFSLSEFSYIDIARQERLAEVNARWPLLNELNAMQRKEK